MSGMRLGVQAKSTLVLGSNDKPKVITTWESMVATDGYHNFQSWLPQRPAVAV